MTAARKVRLTDFADALKTVEVAEMILAQALLKGNQVTAQK